VHANHPLALPTAGALASRAYDQAIQDVMREIQAVTGTDASAADLLRAAALEFKRSSGKFTTPEDYAARFAECVPGLSAQDQVKLEHALLRLGKRTPVSGSR